MGRNKFNENNPDTWEQYDIHNIPSTIPSGEYNKGFENSQINKSKDKNKHPILRGLGTVVEVVTDILDMILEIIT